MAQLLIAAVFLAGITDGFSGVFQSKKHLDYIRITGVGNILEKVLVDVVDNSIVDLMSFPFSA